MRVAAVIPAYNAGDGLGTVVRRAVLQVDGENVIVVDDGSTDGSCGPDHLSGVTCLTHPKNLGKGAALKTGIREALSLGVDAVIMLDADGQHDPSHIPSLVSEAERSNADLVIGSRMGNVGCMPWLRRITNWTTSAVVSLLAGQRVDDSQSGFRLVRARALRGFDLKTSRYETESEMLIQAGRRGFKIRTVPISSIYDQEKSNIRPLADTFRFIRLIIRSVLTRREDVRERCEEGESCVRSTCPAGDQR